MALRDVAQTSRLTRIGCSRFEAFKTNLGKKTPTMRRNNGRNITFLDHVSLEIFTSVSRYLYISVSIVDRNIELDWMIYDDIDL